MTSLLAAASQNPRTTLVALLTSTIALAGSLAPLAAHYADIARLLGDPVAATVLVCGAIATAAAALGAVGASILQLLPAKPAHDVGSEPAPTAGVHAGKEIPPMTLLQDLGLLEAGAGELASFAAGSPISATKTIGNTTYTASAVHLPAGPTPDYQELSGSPIQILELALGDAAAIAAGQPVKIAEKIGNTWYGLTFAIATKTG